MATQKQQRRRAHKGLALCWVLRVLRGLGATGTLVACLAATGVSSQEVRQADRFTEAADMVTPGKRGSGITIIRKGSVRGIEQRKKCGIEIFPRVEGDGPGPGAEPGATPPSIRAYPCS